MALLLCEQLSWSDSGGSGAPIQNRPEVVALAYRPSRLRQNRVTTSCEIGSRPVCRHACPTQKPAELRSSSSDSPTLQRGSERDWQERKEAYVAHLRTADDDVLWGIAGGQGSQRARDPSRLAKTRYWRKKSGPASVSPKKKRFGTTVDSPSDSAKNCRASLLTMHEIVQVLEAAG